MKTPREAQETILKEIKRLGTEPVALTSSLGRILAEDAVSNRNHPPCDISAMDGYAVISSDIKGASKSSPAALEIIDDIRAGTEPSRTVSKGTASRIMTGAPVPDGADAVIRVEDTDTDGKNVKIFVPQEAGANIRLLGENLKTGDKVLAAGTQIGPAELGILAMVKKEKVLVFKRPRVAVLSTGDELEGLAEPFNERKIPDANSYTLMAQAIAAGCDVTMLGIARDKKEELEEKLKEGLVFDVLIASGGVAVGHHDFVRPTLASLGIDIKFWRVAIRPGHPMAFGTAKEAVIFAMPGNPVSSMVCFEEFVLPALRKMTGAKNIFRRTIKARLAEDVEDKKGRVHFMRSVLEVEKSGFSTRLTGSQGSGILKSMVEADGLMVFPGTSDVLKSGETVTVQPLYGFEFQEESGLPEGPALGDKKNEK